MACVPERVHLFPWGEGYRGRHGEAVIVTLVAVVGTWRPEPLKKSFPNKRQHAVRVGDKYRERWGLYAEELLSQCYSVWTPLQQMFYHVRIFSAI